MMQARNELCSCGSGKKFKNCCMESSGNSFIKKNAIKILVLGGMILLLGNAIFGIFDKIEQKKSIPSDWEWCENCRAWKAPGHNNNK